MENPLEAWARRQCGLVEMDSIAWTYSGEGPPSWRQPREEIEQELNPAIDGNWWYAVCLADLLTVADTNSRVLDIGCGPGWPAIALSGHVRSVAALDASLLGLNLLNRNLRQRRVCNVFPICSDAQVLPIADKSIDVVIGSDVINVVADPLQLLSEVRRVLRPEGRTVQWVQNFRRILGGQDYVSCREFSVTETGSLYRVHTASLAPPHSVDIDFRLAMDRDRALDPEEGMREVDLAVILEELEQLREAIRGPALLYRAIEQTPKSVSLLFEQAGFRDVQVMSLDHEAWCQIAAGVEVCNKTSYAAADILNQAHSIRSSLCSRDPEGSWEVSIHAKK